MMLFDESLKRLYFSGMISRDEAMANARAPDQLARALSA
jgi:Tfp pilus assembly pilus retraction ATPase PilT